MSERLTHPMPSNTSAFYPSTQPQQWHQDPQYPSGYPATTAAATAAHYPTYGHDQSQAHPQVYQQQHYHPVMSGQSSTMTNYQSPDRTSPYSHGRTSPIIVPQHPGYSSMGHQGAPALQHSAAMHEHSHSQSFSRTHPPVHPYAGTSHIPHHSAGLPDVAHAHSQYQSHAAGYAHSMDHASQYPASPQRPFSCDMCALSFNRQHDLKRHRDTHTGEKPFLCNGGCGKTFTRKDALKRHQLVKRCGIEESTQTAQDAS